MHQRPSRCWTCASVSAATANARSPQPSRTARMARSRSPFTRNIRRAEQRLSLSQRQPVSDTDADRLRALYATDAGRQLRCEQHVVGRLDRPLPDWDIRMMIDEEPKPRASSDTRQVLTVAFVKPGRGSCRYQAINSSSVMLYTRRVIGEETL